MTIAAQAESILTPDFARTLVRLAALRTGSALFDDDLVQEALLRGLIAFRRAIHIQYPRTFFSKIVRDAVSDHWRRRRVFLPLESIGQDALAPALDFERRLDQGRQLSRIRRALSVLSPAERELMELFYFEDVPVGKLSLMLGKSRSALKMALLRSRNKLIQALTKDFKIQKLQPQNTKEG